MRLVAAMLVAATSLVPAGAAAAAASPAPAARSATGCASAAARHVTARSRVERAVDRAPRGAVICFAAGTYRLANPIRPRQGQTLVGHQSILSGARVIHHFERSGRFWVATGQRDDGQRSGYCLPAGSRACTYPNDVLSDGRPLRRVLARSSVRPGRYYVSHATRRLYLGSDPRGHEIEVETARAAIESRATDTDVTVRGFTVEHFASPAQHGAIDTDVPGWLIAGNVVTVNHGAGIAAEGHVRILHNTIARNGEEGITGTGNDTLVAHNVIAGNDTDHFDPAWEAGGAKWALVDGLVVRDNIVRNNIGPGLWTDIDSQHTTYEGNDVSGNTLAGIFHEISGPATISDNTVTGNGHGDRSWLWGSGILLAASHDVKVTGNTLNHNEQGIGLIQQNRGRSSIDGTARVLHDIAISHNVVHLSGGDSGIVEDDGDEALFTDDTITWTDDDWYGVRGTPFDWQDTEISAAAWRHDGHDVSGTFHP